MEASRPFAFSPSMSEVCGQRERRARSFAVSFALAERFYILHAQVVSASTARKYQGQKVQARQRRLTISTVDSSLLSWLIIDANVGFYQLLVTI